MTSIFITLIDVRPLAGCKIDPDEFNGASVRCYIPATHETEARSLLAKTLESCCFELMEEEFFVQEDLVEWENPNNEDGRRCSLQARSDGNVVFSEFNGWGHDDPDAYPSK